MSERSVYNHRDWIIFPTFKLIYNVIHDEIINAAIVKHLDCPVFIDHHGNNFGETNDFELKMNRQWPHHSYLIFADLKRCSTSQKNDSHASRSKWSVQEHTKPQVLTSTVKNRFRLLLFISAPAFVAFLFFIIKIEKCLWYIHLFDQFFLSLFFHLFPLPNKLHCCTWSCVCCNCSYISSSLSSYF